MGCGLVADIPLSDERREIIARETAREEQAEHRRAAFAAEQANDARIELAAELRRQGREAHTVLDVLQAAAVAADRQDRVDARLEREAAELLGGPPPRPTPRALLAKAAAEREARKAEEEATPATVAEVGKVKKQLQNLATGVFAVSGHRIPL